MAQLFKATVKSTGEQIQVYRLEKGGWCDYANCKTEYSKEELIIKL